MNNEGPNSLPCGTLHLCNQTKITVRTIAGNLQNEDSGIATMDAGEGLRLWEGRGVRGEGYEWYDERGSVAREGMRFIDTRGFVEKEKQKKKMMRR